MTTTGYTGARPPERFNMAAYAVGRAAARWPDKPALIVYDDIARGAPSEIWTFAELERAVLAAGSGLLARGLKPGDRIMLRLANTSDYAILYFGAIAAGLVALPASSQLTPGEAHFLLENSQSVAVALTPDADVGVIPNGVKVLEAAEIARMIRGPVSHGYADTAADDPAFLIYTSGSTSRPKGVVHAHRSAWGRRPMYRGWYGLGESDRMLHAGAFNWTYTLGTGLTDPWANGATSIVYTGEKTPELWPRLIRETQATIFAAVPTLYRQILKYAAPSRISLGALRHGLIAGETPPPGLMTAWTEETGRTLYEALGMSEMSTYVSSSPSVPPRVGFVGRPQEGRSVAILPLEGRATTPLAPGAEGLLAVHRSDPGLMLGYWKRPEEEAEVMRGDWFIGGDVAVMDADGYVAHVGRANDIMKAQGYRVSPLEVEAVLAGHPDVAEIAAAEVRVREDLSVIGAFVVAREGATPSETEILGFAAQRLATYKQPKLVVFLDALPRTANGKVRRASLKVPQAS